MRGCGEVVTVRGMERGRRVGKQVGGGVGCACRGGLRRRREIMHAFRARALRARYARPTRRCEQNFANYIAARE
jgi:hypothetical protein